MNSTNRKEPVRLVALSDGLFATVLTLLVLDLRLPDALSAQGGNLTVFLKWVGPHMFSYLLTFFVAGFYWLAHHRDFEHIHDYDRGLLGYNLLFLLFVGLLPFSTAAVGVGGFTSDVFPFYWAIYCANIILAGVLLTLTWTYAIAHGQVDAEVTPEMSLYIIVRQLLTPAVFLVSIAAEYLFPRAYLGPYALILIPVAQRAVDRSYARLQQDGLVGRLGWKEVAWRAGVTLIWVVIIWFAALTSTR